MMRHSKKIEEIGTKLSRLMQKPAFTELSYAERTVITHRRLIRKTVRMGHKLDTLSKELQIPKRTLQRHLNNIGIFFRKPRTKKGKAIKRNIAAIEREKMRVVANV